MSAAEARLSESRDARDEASACQCAAEVEGRRADDARRAAEAQLQLSEARARAAEAQLSDLRAHSDSHA